MAAVMSPNASKNELAGMQHANRLFSAGCRASWSERQVRAFSEQAYQRLVVAGLAEFADGFRQMGYIIAQQRM